MRRLHQLHTDETGSLLVALLGVLVLTGLCTVLVATVASGQRQSGFDRSYEQSLQVAEVGLERAARLVVDRGVELGRTYTEAVEGGTYTVRVEQDGGERVLIATGTATDGTSRTVTATMGEPVFHPIAFFADHLFQASGTSSFCLASGCEDVEPPASLDGLAGTNDKVHFNGVPSMAFGKLQLADWASNDDATARCTFHGGKKVDCRFEESVQHVAERYEILSEERLAHVEQLQSACAPLPATTTLAPGVYCTTSLTLGPLTVAGSTGDVQIVVTGSGSVALGRNGQPANRTVNPTGDATRLQIFAPHADHVALINNSTLKAMVYAPRALCAGQGGVTYHGALLCEEIDTGGNADYFAPDDIGRLRYGHPQLRDWRER